MTTNTLSVFSRKNTISLLTSQTFDLLVIGGGITGAGIALDAASRGMKVALIEKNDFAFGTSSRSTKLIHGGLRYLKQLEFGLVKEVGRERAIVYKNAPHIVHAENMLLPIVENGSLGRTTTALGLSMYDWLAGVRFSEWKQMLTKFATKKKEPLLREDILKGGALYKEYRTDDARLVIEIMKTAAQNGAICLNYAEAVSLVYQEGQVAGAEVKDKIEDGSFAIKAKKVINAAGPWVDEIRAKDNSLKGKKLHLTKGVHLVVPYEKLPIQQSAYFDVPDGRMIFVIPRGKITYIGTTDTSYYDSIDDPQVSKTDVAYLLTAVNYMFPTIQLTSHDITSSWAGLRPLIHEEGKGPSELSRKDEIFVSPSGLLSMAGGKLTGYRKMAERVVDMVAGQLESAEGLSYKKCFTDEITLSGGDFKHLDAIDEFTELQMMKAASEKITLGDIRNLIDRYGTNTEKIILLAQKDGKQVTPESLLFAELQYCLEEEAVTNLNDFFIRRTGKLYFEREQLTWEYPLLKNKIETLLQWSDSQKAFNAQEFEKEYDAVLSFLNHHN